MHGRQNREERMTVCVCDKVERERQRDSYPNKRMLFYIVQNHIVLIKKL